MVPDPKILQDFVQPLSSKDPKAVKAYLSALRGFVQWLSKKPGVLPLRRKLLQKRLSCD